MSIKDYFTRVTVIASISLLLSACGSGGSDGIAINDRPTGTATLTWDAPATRSDGSPLNYPTDLQSYKLYYGTSSHAYSKSISISNPGTTPVSYTVSLPQGTYYFAVTAIDQYGQESGFSPEALKVL